ncbi:formylglycine-generating enzyme family protein [Curtobacterium sp. MCSS17_006]|uniref:formylglycine-generating enzyme family protein n=1 Tax=unclassified Curtobacterium TaxID=257496 RepID=UPI000DAA22DF|nr:MULTISPECIES: formylglycine-generating enzyme family protein [unclassified Curtobacterium]PZE32865.1 formylglycine-generating enzyme family protein [Curtobacterium sp. MCSS17_006]WIB33232.1 formylglycine-generating enzyme family protein [Curtobacterium sp. MCSS17_005]
MTDHTAHDCCAPTGRTRSGEDTRATAVPVAATEAVLVPGHVVEQARVPGQTFLMGDGLGDGTWGDGETPVHPVTVSAFEIDATSVTNDDFARFVAATGYRTEAEVFGDSAVFHLALDADEADVVGQPPQTPWWFGVRGADWRHPGGPRSSIEGMGDHPVVHVSWNDAQAYCDWAGRALPTEAQWEAASRGGLEQARYPWGDDLGAADGDGRPWRVNIFQGTFPTENTTEDGFLTTAPVRTFEPNGYGVWQTVGNVWEWCADVFDVRTYARDAAAGTVTDPTGPNVVTPDAPRVMRGGSYLCHDSYCNRYRNAARSQNTPDSSMGNAGFRTVSRPASGAAADMAAVRSGGAG